MATKRKQFQAPAGDSIIATITAGQPAAPSNVDKKVTPIKKPPAAEEPPRGRYTFHIPHDVMEQARDAVAHLMGPPEYLTLGKLAEEAIRKEVKRLEAQHNDGEPFPKRNVELKGGRKVAMN